MHGCYTAHNDMKSKEIINKYVERKGVTFAYF